MYRPTVMLVLAYEACTSPAISSNWGIWELYIYRAIIKDGGIYNHIALMVKAQV
jgi:hypothetical protein